MSIVINRVITKVIFVPARVLFNVFNNFETQVFRGKISVVS